MERPRPLGQPHGQQWEGARMLSARCTHSRALQKIVILPKYSYIASQIMLRQHTTTSV